MLFLEEVELLLLEEVVELLLLLEVELLWFFHFQDKRAYGRAERRRPVTVRILRRLRSRFRPGTPADGVRAIFSTVNRTLPRD